MEEEMLKSYDILLKIVACCLVAGLVAMMMGCTQATKPTAERKPAVRKIPAGQEFSGFLKDYSALKPHPEMESALTYASTDAQKNLRSYFAIVVDPIEVYVATDVDEGRSPRPGEKH
jgi:hypothetical protein